MIHPFECNQCGNPRNLLSTSCQHCGDTGLPHPRTDYWKVNLEYGAPKVEHALALLEQSIHTALSVGLKAIVVIHGYGSSGLGGRIRNAVRNELQNNRWADCVREFVYCEQLHNRTEIKKNLQVSNALEASLVSEGVLNNSGSTLLLLHKERLSATQ